MTMQVVHIITDLDTGGAEMMLYKLLSGSDRERIAHQVISMTDEGGIAERIRRLGVPVHALGMHRALPAPSALWKLAVMLRSTNPDVVQGWMYHGNLFSLLATKLAAIRSPVVWNVRQSLYSLSHERPMTRMVIRGCALLSGLSTRILYNSSTGAGHHERIGYRTDKSVTIPNGFDMETFAPSPQARRSVREELGLHEDAVLIGLIGRFHPMKDHGNFLRAAADLHRKDPSVHFLLAGKDVVPQNENLTAHLGEGGLSDNVHLLGQRHDIPRLTAALDVAALSSFAEGFPNVVGEAMSCGVPCAVTDVGDAAWIVGDTGIVAPPGDAEALARAMGELVEMGAQRRTALGMLARQRIRDHFSLSAVVQRYEHLYESLLLR